MKHTHSFILSCIVLFGAGNIFSANVPTNKYEKKDSLTFYFSQGKSDIDYNISNNSVEFQAMDSLLKDRDIAIRNVQIIGSASPEGGISLNYKLSDQRAEKILSKLRNNTHIDPDKIKISFVGRDWKRLLEFIESDPEVPYKAQTTSLLEEIVAGLSTDTVENEHAHNLQRLEKLENGIPYAYLYRNVFPYLRASRLYFTTSILPIFDREVKIPEINAITPDIGTDYLFFQETPSLKQRKNFYMALKTNMLYDILLLPSISAEFYLGKNFSTVANWMYGWWNKDISHRYWRAYGGDLAVRWWFGHEANRKPLTGHHVGVYGGITTFDFEFGNKGYMGGLPGETLWNRSLRMFGVEYGYSLPIAKRLNIDFTLGIGYLGGKYIKYIAADNKYLWQSTHKVNWFGPTKAEISLTWLIGHGNYNNSKRKGGN